MDSERKESIALWRLGVLGPLISARLEHGDRRALFEAAAARVHERPDGRLLRLSPRTIEDWYYRYRKGGFAALYPGDRSDLGRSRAIGSELSDLILKIKREKPRRSIRRIIRMVEREGLVARGQLSRSSVHRLLQAHDISQRPVRGPAAERRSFIMAHASDLWVGDALHGPHVLAPDGELRKAYLLSQIDCATRYLTHSFWALSEGAAHQEYGLKQAILKYGPPRCYYVDLGSAYVARSLKLICADLGVHLLHAGVQDCEAKGVIERWHRTLREEVLDELDDRVVTLDELNSIHWAWLASEYHSREHDTTERIPQQHWLDEVDYLQPVPRHLDLDQVFLHRTKRHVRKDGTVRFGGTLIEVRPELVGRKVELRFDPLDSQARPRVFLGGRFVCDTVPLDRLRNATRRRRRNLGSPEPQAEPSGLNPLRQLTDQHHRRSRPFGDVARADDPNDTED